MKSKKFISFLFLLCLTNIGCLSIKSQTIELEKKEIESQIITDSPKFSYFLTISDTDTSEKIKINILGTKSISKIKKTKYSVHQVEERKFDGINETWKKPTDHDRSGRGMLCLGAMLSPILLPIDLIRSINKDLGTNTIVQNEPLSNDDTNLNPTGILRVTDGTVTIDISILNGFGNLIKKNVLFDNKPSNIIFIDKDNKIEQTIISEELNDLIATYSNDNKLHIGKCISGTCINGEGTISFGNDDQYTGEFKNGKPDGKGTFKYNNGEEYIGQLKNGKRHGNGTLLHNSDGKYIGQWKDDKFDGQGTMIYSNGNKYIGHWRDGKRDGQGTFTYEGGYSADLKYVGQWKDDKANGQGTHTIVNFLGVWQRTYIGQFKDDQYHGKGTMTYRDGHKESGKWHEGEFIGE